MTNEQRSAGTLRGSWTALAGLSAVFLVEMLDNSILHLALPTIGRELQASTLALQWVTSSYAVVFGSLMLAFGALADRFGRRRLMLVGLTLLGASSLAIAVVTTAEQLIVLRALMGVAAAMTTPGTMALAFRLFDEEGVRVRAITLISTVGLVGLALGPVLGGLVLTAVPWQMLLMINAPIALLAGLGIRAGIAADDPSELHRESLDVLGALLATAAITLALLAPTAFVQQGAGTWEPWAVTLSAVILAGLFVLRERSAAHPLLDLGLIARPSVSSGLAFKTAAGLATAGLGYLVTLQLQLAWGWSPALAALGMLPQVVVLLALGPFVNRLVQRVGIDRAAAVSATSIVVGLAVHSLLGGSGYVWIAIALALVAGGLRVIGVVSAISVMDGLPANRTSIGAALVDTTTEVAHGVGIAVAGTVLAAVFAGSITAADWSVEQAAQFNHGVTLGALLLTVLAAALVGFGIVRSRASSRQRAPVPLEV